MTNTLNLFDQPSEKSEKKWFNTISAVNPELSKNKRDANAQEKRIMEVFKDGQKYTPLAIERLTGINHDSVKRAITCLTKAGKLIKLGKDDMVMESKGKNNHRWVIAL